MPIQRTIAIPASIGIATVLGFPPELLYGEVLRQEAAGSSAEDLAASRMAQSYRVSFAKNGDPNGAGLPIWPRHDPKKDVIFEFKPDGPRAQGPIRAKRGST